MTGGPWLVGDVGGTNARFALVESPGAAPSRVRVLPTRDFTGLGEAAAAYLAEEDVRPAAACLAVAGPVGGGRYHLTNAAWEPGTVGDVRERLGLPFVEVVNDFAALAASLPALGADDVRPVGGDAAPAPDGTAPLAVLGPGTGLGVAGLVPASGRWLPAPGEGGHVDVPAATDEEIEVARLLRAERGAASAELLLSGDGLARLHRLLGTVRGTPPEPRTAAQIVADLDDPLCADAVGMFCALLGSFAGNAALTLGARGGVYLGGGILPRIADTLRASDFRARFEAKPPVEGYLRAIPTALIVHPYPALLGAAAHLEQAAVPTLETV
ncbi:glucokinase [Actinomadura rubrobrunea]|uniref:Glucokinase n=1 Tax=Actinomadura rubrobrunea TaxID=115335 RepID=A0A9W6PV03_9ACTN|nr:glucokinase [Actinomadura rubrobrunea]GLW64117.1 glucokinase [Actinomadura rubrobrunea]